MLNLVSQSMYYETKRPYQFSMTATVSNSPHFNFDTYHNPFYILIRIQYNKIGKYSSEGETNIWEKL